MEPIPAPAIKVVFYIGGGEMNKKTQWPPSKHTNQFSSIDYTPAALTSQSIITNTKVNVNVNVNVNANASTDIGENNQYNMKSIWWFPCLSFNLLNIFKKS